MALPIQGYLRFPLKAMLSLWGRGGGGELEQEMELHKYPKQKAQTITLPELLACYVVGLAMVMRSIVEDLIKEVKCSYEDDDGIRLRQLIYHSIDILNFTTYNNDGCDHFYSLPRMSLNWNLFCSLPFNLP